MNKSEFITVVAQKSGQPKALTADIINAALEAITETVQKKESISIVAWYAGGQGAQGPEGLQSPDPGGSGDSRFVPAVLQARQQAEGSRECEETR